MYRKIVWCYVLVLTLLDISLNTKLTAQGKSHDVTVHDSLIEGISFQEWGKDGSEGAVGAVGAAGAVGGAAAAEALRLAPTALRFGRAALGAAHALTVTLTNTHNATVHLASVAGTTPDFHASFFESKTLPPNGNTTFSVVYLGRREGPVAAHLYIHTSLGVHKYPVSAEGVASEWGVWPLVGLRVPHNATLDPVLTLHNPTDKPIQVREVYSSGSWVGLRLPGGGGAAPRDAWRVPPHATRPLVRLALRLPPAQHPHPHPHSHPHPHPHPPRPLTAYIRIKGDNVGGTGGLVVGVEAAAAAPGAFLTPPQLRLRLRGARDPPHTFDILAGNSGTSPVRVEASVWGARCGPQPLDLPPPPADQHTANGQAPRATTNGECCCRQRHSPVRVEASVWGARCGPQPLDLPPPPADQHTANGQAPRATTNGECCCRQRHSPVRVEASVWGARCGPQPLDLPPPPADQHTANGQAPRATTNGECCCRQRHSPVRVEASVWGARCGPQPLDLPPPPADQHTANGQAPRATTNGVKSEGAHVTVVRPQLAAHQDAIETLQLTLDYARLWASYAGSGGAAVEPGAGMWCGGWVRMGACAVPYSLRLLPGTLRLEQTLEVVTASQEEALRERTIRIRNEFPAPALLSALDVPSEITDHFHVVEQTPVVVAPNSEGVVGRIRLRSGSLGAQLHSHITLRTNLTKLELPVLLHSGLLELEWEWPNSEDGHLRLGAVGASSTSRVGVRLRNPTVARLCVTQHALSLRAAQFTLPACRCISPGESAQAWLTVVAPARGGPLAGELHVSTPHGAAAARLSLAAHAGRLAAPPLRLADAAPYSGSSAPLVLESSMALRMRVLNVTQPRPDPALSFEPTEPGWVTAGSHAVGAVHYAPEKACEPNCYTGLDITTPEGEAWLRRGEEGDPASLGEDIDLLRARRAMFTPQHTNITLYLHTTEVVQVPVTGTVLSSWPRLRVDSGVGGVGGAGGLLAGVGGAAAARLRLRNPSTRPLLLHPALTSQHYHREAGGEPNPDHHDPEHLLHPQDVEGLESFCKKNKCVWSHDAFSITAWHAPAAGVSEWRPGNATCSPILMLSPGAELELSVTFAPARAAPLAAYLYLRNNLTIAEIIPLWGRGAYPSVALAGRRPGHAAPLLFEVTECGEGGGGGSGAGGGGGGGGGVVRRTVSVHNTGDVPLKLRDWRLAGRPCQARGFRLQPCAGVSLAPNESRPLRLSFAADYTLTRVVAALTVRADAQRIEFALHAKAPADLLKTCAAKAPRPPFEPALRAAGALLALAALALVLAAAALDAERELRRARAARTVSPPPTRTPLDLRAVASPPVSTPPQNPRPPPPRRRRAARRPPALDPAAERRAFERWRAEVLRRADDDEDEHSSEETEVHSPLTTPPEPEARDRSPSPPTPTDRRSSDEEGPSIESSVGSDSSASLNSEAGRDSSSPTERRRARPDPVPRATPVLNDTDNRTEDTSRSFRTRREASPPRRADAGRRDDVAGRPRAPPAGRAGHARRDKGARRRPPPAGAPSLRTPPPAEPRAPPAALRWDTTWSEVVAASHSTPPQPAQHNNTTGGPAPLPPIGSDVRRRGPGCGGGGGAGGAEAGDHSLFYFNGDPPAPPAPPAPPGPAWRATPPLERPAYAPPQPDYRPEFDDTSNMNAYGSLWTGPSGSAWAWGGGFAGVRPPPGFAAPPPPRAYDPFRSLAAIWAPGALDWHPDPAPPAPAAAVAPVAPVGDAHASSLDAPPSRSVVNKTE